MKAQPIAHPPILMLTNALLIASLRSLISFSAKSSSSRGTQFLNRTHHACSMSSFTTCWSYWPALYHDDRIGPLFIHHRYGQNGKEVTRLLIKFPATYHVLPSFFITPTTFTLLPFVVTYLSNWRVSGIAKKFFCHFITDHGRIAPKAKFSIRHETAILNFQWLDKWKFFREAIEMHIAQCIFPDLQVCVAIDNESCMIRYRCSSLISSSSSYLGEGRVLQISTRDSQVRHLRRNPICQYR